jgi:hypothetical protein
MLPSRHRFLTTGWREIFTFVPGPFARPAGAVFTVACPKLVFAEPDFIF